MVSSSALDTNLSQPPASTPMDVGMHKEDQQAAGGLTSLGVTRCDASADSTVEVDLGKSDPNDSIPQQQGMDEGTQNNSFDQLFIGTNPNVLTDKIQSIEEPSLGGDEFTCSDEISKKIKLEDLSKLVQNVKADFMDLDSLEDDHIIMMDESEEDEEEKD
ncbi:hypothetical protein Tco_0585292 [Tanacetum coccineum]